MGSSQMVSISLYPWKLDCIPFPPPTAHLVPLEVNKQLQVSALSQAQQLTLVLWFNPSPTIYMTPWKSKYHNKNIPIRIYLFKLEITVCMGCI